MDKIVTDFFKLMNLPEFRNRYFGKPVVEAKPVEKPKEEKKPARWKITGGARLKNNIKVYPAVWIPAGQDYKEDGQYKTGEVVSTGERGSYKEYKPEKKPADNKQEKEIKPAQQDSTKATPGPIKKGENILGRLKTVNASDFKKMVANPETKKLLASKIELVRNSSQPEEPPDIYIEGKKLTSSVALIIAKNFKTEQLNAEKAAQGIGPKSFTDKWDKWELSKTLADLLGKSLTPEQEKRAKEEQKKGINEGELVELMVANSFKQMGKMDKTLNEIKTEDPGAYNIMLQLQERGINKNFDIKYFGKEQVKFRNFDGSEAVVEVKKGMTKPRTVVAKADIEIKDEKGNTLGVSCKAESGKPPTIVSLRNIKKIEQLIRLNLKDYPGYLEPKDMREKDVQEGLSIFQEIFQMKLDNMKNRPLKTTGACDIDVNKSSDKEIKQAVERCKDFSQDYKNKSLGVKEDINEAEECFKRDASGRIKCSDGTGSVGCEMNERFANWVATPTGTAFMIKTLLYATERGYIDKESPGFAHTLIIAHKNGEMSIQDAETLIKNICKSPARRRLVFVEIGTKGDGQRVRMANSVDTGKEIPCK